MRVGVVVLVLLAVGSGSGAAADRTARAHPSRPAERIYSALLPLPDPVDQVDVERGPRLLLEDDFLGLFEPVFTARRLPSRARRVQVQAEHPLYERLFVATERPRYSRRSVRRAPAEW